MHAIYCRKTEKSWGNIVCYLALPRAHLRAYLKKKFHLGPQHRTLLNCVPGQVTHKRERKVSFGNLAAANDIVIVQGKS